MPTKIRCPKCANEFDIEEVLYSEVEGKLEKQNQEKLNESLKAVEVEKELLSDEKKKFEETKKNENEIFAKKIAQERIKIQEDEKNKAFQESVTKIKFLEEKSINAESKIKQLEGKELEALQLKNEVDELKRNHENEKKKYLLENTPKLIDDALSKEKERFDMEKKVWEIKMEQQKKLIEEMERKANQGSMQTQGEVQELALEELLRASFPFDVINEVGKGVRGADCIQTIRNNFGQECGKIIFESKRRQNFSHEWIEKLKADMRIIGADVAVIVTSVLPKDMDRFGEKDGVWICSFAEVKPIVQMLRDGIIKISTALKSQENRGDKMHLLYDYLTSREFAEQWQAIREGFMSMKLSIQKERDAMEKLWKQREKQLEKVLLNAAHVRGSIEGISGTDVDLNLLENTGDGEES